MLKILLLFTTQYLYRRTNSHIYIETYKFTHLYHRRADSHIYIIDVQILFRIGKF